MNDVSQTGMPLAPPIDRVAVGESPIDPHHEDSLLVKYPLSQRPWTKVLKRRQKLSKAITFTILSMLLYATYVILTGESIDTTSMILYIVIYMTMSYFLFYSLVKTLIGTWAMMRNQHLPDHPSTTARDPDEDTKVAILFPVYHEDVVRVAAGMAAVYESLRDYTKSQIKHYDIFLLSDSREPSCILSEKAAIIRLRHQYPEMRFYYRHRPSNHNAKIGNVTDFCRRWGRQYKYMFTMDADSVVAGQTIHATLRMMEGNEKVGILQTNPKAILRKTIFGRMQQFSGNIFGRAFAASLQSTMLGNAVYMGHNAMLRVEPFIQFCILPEMSGAAPWGGKPLSHDIVESAMMAAHGYECWFLPELSGSWEEVPANILASLIRERRWMQGNLQHIRFLPVKGVPAAYKEYFINGMFAYFSAPLWAVFLLVSSHTVLQFIRNGIVDPETAMLIVIDMLIVGIVTLCVFLIIRFVAIGMVFNKTDAPPYGGKIKIVISSVIEFFFSMLYSPIVMMAMSKFIYFWARRKSIKWNAQDRGDDQLSYVDCFQYFGWMTASGVLITLFLTYEILQIPEQDAGLMVAVSNGWFSPYVILYWMIPILSGMILSPWLCRWTSKPVPWFEEHKLFLIPEEYNVPKEVTTLRDVQAMFEREFPDQDDLESVFRYIQHNGVFREVHMRDLRDRIHVEDRLLPRIQSGEDLHRRDLYLALNERQCFMALMNKYNPT